MKRSPPVLAWAAVGKKSGKVLRGLDEQYAIYTTGVLAKADCPSYGEVRPVEIRVVGIPARSVRGILA